MGNLEKAGVLVVVALLAVILVVAFLNFPDQAKPPVLGASAAKGAPLAEVKKPTPKPEPVNLYPDPEVIRPKVDLDRPSTDAPPRMNDAPVSFVSPNPAPAGPKGDETAILPKPISMPKSEPVVHEEKKTAASPWPKVVKVQSGEALWTIAVREYGAKLGPRMLSAIADANPKVRPEAIKAGTELSLPAPPAEAGVASKSGDEPRAPAKPAPKPPAKEPASSKPARKLPFVPE